VHAFFVALIVVQGATWLTAAVGACGVQRGIDGYVAAARDDARGFLDPLADKVVVLSSLFALAAEATSRGPILLIAAREVYMSVYRSFAGARASRSRPGTRRS